jgi:hypothetical protein
MAPKLCFIHQLFFCTRLDSWILIGIGSLEREEERGSIDTCERNEGLGTRSSGRLDLIGGGYVSGKLLGDKFLPWDNFP